MSFIHVRNEGFTQAFLYFADVDDYDVQRDGAGRQAGRQASMQAGGDAAARLYPYPVHGSAIAALFLARLDLLLILALAARASPSALTT